jgi:uncharacterized protein YggE
MRHCDMLLLQLAFQGRANAGDSQMRSTAMLAALLASPAFAQTSGPAQHTIEVTGHGKVSVPPDTANIHYWLRGEGKTADEATQSMVDAQSRVENGIKAFLGRDAQITNSDLVVIEARDPNCKAEPGRAALSEGECSIIGYVASAQADVTTPNVDKAGTSVGLASRLGARDARLQSFELRETAGARQSAMARAVNDAREQAQVLASAAGGHLGRVLHIQYGSYSAVPFLHGIPTVGAPPPPPPPPPIEVHMEPRPQDISADVSVSYELLP